MKRSTRIENAPLDLYDPDEPRLGRRESEPHSAEITYIYDILTTNFPDSRTIWDLHHYFTAHKDPLKGQKIDIQFDISFFKNLSIPHTLSSYKAKDFDDRVPDLAINVLSKSTWRADLSENVDICKSLGISVYVVFSPYKVTSKVYHPPFMRAYILREDGSYEQIDLYDVTLKKEESINEKNSIKLNEKLPFHLGLMKLDKQHEGGSSLYRLVFLDHSNLTLLLTEIEQIKKEKEQIKKEKTIAEKKVKELQEKIQEMQTKTKNKN